MRIQPHVRAGFKPAPTLRAGSACPLFAKLAALMLAITFTISCSSDDGSGNDPGGTSSPSGGELSSSGGNGGGDSSSSSAISGGSLTGTSGTIKDDRDNESYKWVKIDEQYWLAENLNYAVDGAKCYGDGGEQIWNAVLQAYEPKYTPAEIQAHCDKYGKLYDWATAMGIEAKYNNETWGGNDVKHQGICPAGWHIPNYAELSALINYVGDDIENSANFNAGIKLRANSALWDTNIGTDDYGFAALPGGYGIFTNGGNNSFPNAGYQFGNVGRYGEWWSATSSTNYYGINVNYTDVRTGKTDKTNLYSVRCIKD